MIRVVADANVLVSAAAARDPAAPSADGIGVTVITPRELVERLADAG